MKQDSYRRTVSLLAAAFALAPWPGRAQAPVYTIFTVAGNNTNSYSGDGGPANQAALSNPCKVAADGSGNLFIADQTNSRVREVSGGTISTIAGNGTAGYSGDGKTPTEANISAPCGVAVDAKGNVYFSQTSPFNSAVRKAAAGGNMSTVAGTALGAGFSGDGGAGSNAQVNYPTGLALDPAGNLYIADTVNNRIRVIGTDGKINTFAGNGVSLSLGDGGPAIRATLNTPQGVAADAAGNVYIADTLNNRVRKVSGGFITTVAGTGRSGFSGDNGPATKAQLNHPADVAVDAAGNLFIADTFNSRIRLVTPDGAIYTIAGGSRSGYAGDGGPGTSARLLFPQGIALGPNGILYVADTQNQVIRLLTPAAAGNPGAPITPGTVPTITSVISSAACGGSANVSPGAWIEIRGSALAADTRQSTPADFQGNNAPTSLVDTQVTIAGQSAVLLYVSPTQVNAQVPLAVSPGQQQVLVTAGGVSGLGYTVTVNPAQPGLCQGVSLAGNPYVSAVVANTSTSILPSGASVAGVDSRPAKPGEVISLFGNGFGAVIPPPAQGQLVQQPNQITGQLQIFFGSTPVAVQYAGLATGQIGVYRFDVVVPDIPDSDLVPVTFALDNFAGAPTLYTAVKH